MKLVSILEQIDTRTARAFVEAARGVIDAMMIEAQRVRQAHGPGYVDYGSAGLSREAAGFGWISDEEVRSATQRMSEAIAAEKWVDGVLFAIKAMSMFGGMA